MSQPIIEAETKLEKLLPARRLKDGAPDDLVSVSKQWSELVWQQALQSGPIKLSKEQLSDGLALIQRPVFICGVHRSGTTLVQNLLDDHPQLVVLPSEGTFYTNQEIKLNKLPAFEQAKYLGTEWLRRMANPINQAPYFLLGRSDQLKSPYVEFARYVLAWWNVLPHTQSTQWPHSAIVLAYASCTNKLKAKYWIDKTPSNERFLDRIWTEFTTAKIIHVVREPLATLTSRKIMEPAITLGNALRHLKKSYQVATNKKIVNDHRFHLLKYESLCDDTSGTIAALTNFLKIENSVSLTQVTTAGLPTKANSSYQKDSSIGQIVERTDHMRMELFNQDERKFIAARIGREALILGYDTDIVNRLGQLYAKMKYLLFANQ